MLVVSRANSGGECLSRGMREKKLSKGNSNIIFRQNGFHKIGIDKSSATSIEVKQLVPVQESIFCILCLRNHFFTFPEKASNT